MIKISEFVNTICEEYKQIYMYYETNSYHKQCRDLTPIYPLESIDKIEEILL